MKHKLLESKLIPILCGLVLTFLASWIIIYPPIILHNILQQLNNAAYDLRQTLLLPKNSKPTHSIVIVDVDEKSLKAEGRWPWPRSKIAQLTQELKEQGAVVIAFDMLFPEPEPNIAASMLKRLEQSKLATPSIVHSITEISPYFDNDAIFAKALANDKNQIVLGTFFDIANYEPIGLLPDPMMTLSPSQANTLVLPSMKTYIGNIPVLQKVAEKAGFISIIPDADGIIRRYSLVMRYGDNLYPSLSLEAVRLYLLLNTVPVKISALGDYSVIESLQLGNNIIPTDIDGRVFIPYIGRSRSFPYYSATDVLNKKMAPRSLENALVFVGTSAIGLNDIRSTAIAGVYPGVEIHANVAEGLLRNHFPYVPVWAPGAELFFIIFIGILFSILFVYVGPLWNIVITLSSLAGIFVGSAWLWQMTGIILPIVLPMIQIFLLAIFNIVYGFFAETRKRFELRRVFTQYVPPAHVDEILQHPDDISGLAGERKIMTVLFMDIRHFTSIAEKLAIGDLKKLLNFFFTEMTNVIFKHDGTVDKYVGDMIMAFWGAPLSDEDHAKHAVLAGLDMQKTTEQLQQKLKEMHLPEVHIGIGINTGMMDVGDMGSIFRRAYTVLGDAVNLGSRLESLTKYYGVGIIVGQETYDINKNDFVFRELDKVQVKGKEQGIAIYEPLGLIAEIDDATKLDIERHHQGLCAYYQQQWDQALVIFDELRRNTPLRLYEIYMKRIRFFKTHSPGPNWNGVWVHEEK